MMETIDAVFPVNVEPAFATPSEAIAFSKYIARVREVDGVASCIGRLVRCSDWREDAMFLHLENGKILHFRCAGHVVDLKIEDGWQFDVAVESRTSDVALVRLAAHEIHWKRGELIRTLENNAVLRIHASATGFFLYASSVGIVWISVLVNRLAGRPFLFWELTD